MIRYGLLFFLRYGFIMSLKICLEVYLFFSFTSLFRAYTLSDDTYILFLIVKHQVLLLVCY
jgi:hypothetical protein